MSTTYLVRTTNGLHSFHISKNECSSYVVLIAKYVVRIHWPKHLLHETSIFLWPRGRCGDILGHPEDQFGPAVTEIVKMRLELRDIVARLDGRNAGGLLRRSRCEVSEFVRSGNVKPPSIIEYLYILG